MHFWNFSPSLGKHLLLNPLQHPYLASPSIHFSIPLHQRSQCAITESGAQLQVSRQVLQALSDSLKTDISRATELQAQLAVCHRASYDDRKRAAQTLGKAKGQAGSTEAVRVDLEVKLAAQTRRAKLAKRREREALWRACKAAGERARKQGEHCDLLNLRCSAAATAIAQERGEDLERLYKQMQGGSITAAFRLHLALNKHQRSLDIKIALIPGT